MRKIGLIFLLVLAMVASSLSFAWTADGDNDIIEVPQEVWNIPEGKFQVVAEDIFIEGVMVDDEKNGSVLSSLSKVTEFAIFINHADSRRYAIYAEKEVKTDKEHGSLKFGFCQLDLVDQKDTQIRAKASFVKGVQSWEGVKKILGPKLASAIKERLIGDCNCDAPRPSKDKSMGI